MTIKKFLQTVKANGWTLAELRCDVRPSATLLEFMELVGMAKYERFVMALQSEVEKRQNA